jgi:hypothetical protein
MKTRNGKIARLPHDVREELNARLERSERSPQLLVWFNALPEVREFVQREFGGEPVSKHNWGKNGRQGAPIKLRRSQSQSVAVIKWLSMDVDTGRSFYFCLGHW